MDLLEFRTHPAFLQILISKSDFEPAKLPGLSRNGSQDTKFVSATNVARAGKRRNIRVGNNEPATMCPRLPVPL